MHACSSVGTVLGTVNSIRRHMCIIPEGLTIARTRYTGITVESDVGTLTSMRTVLYCTSIITWSLFVRWFRRSWGWWEKR
ncbi:hypothetical protein L873DRAFT_1806918 [Choiromyces venosus 120613-1]|uniref:Uncharacterized protein n=1 Tax=Choiromyces venosus 120613-1 TaxID=1336337 RepID=A0A3N4K0D7_9PEZI|nr:hypothetical protein L873DRAFT_1806918 [Choiromyces venosus 120613-1]